MYGLRQMYRRVENHFLTHPMEVQGDVGHVESRFVRLGTVLVSVQDRCMVCAKCIIGSEIVLDAPNGTPG